VSNGGYPVSLFSISSSTNFSTGGSLQGHLTIPAPASPTTYALHCVAPSGVTGPVQAPLQVTIGGSASNVPTANIEADGAGYGVSVSVPIGTVVDLDAYFTPGSDDTIQKTSIIDNDLVLLPGVSELVPPTDKSATYSTTTPGSYTFYPSVWTTNYPQWSNYGSSVTVEFTCSDPNAAGPNCSECEQGYAQDGEGICQPDACLDIPGLQEEVPEGSDPDAGETGICMPDVPLPTLNSFNATRVRSGQASTLSWTVDGMATGIICTISPTPASGQIAWDDVSDPWSGMAQTAPITQATEYTLTCSNGQDPDISKGVIVNIIPSFQEI